MEDGKKDVLNSEAAKLMLLVLIPLIGIGGTAFISYIRLFSLKEIYLNTAIATALCIISEVPLKSADFEEEGSKYLVLSYAAGLLLSLLSGLCFEFMLPLSAPAVLIGFVTNPFNGAVSLLLFSGISFLVLYESSVYFFYIMITGFMLLVLFAPRKNISPVAAAIAYFSICVIGYVSCLFLSDTYILPEVVFFPAIGAVLNFIIIMIVRPKILINAIAKKELYYKSVVDPEFVLMQELKKDYRREYDIAIHTAHFCDILTEKMNADRRKSLGICYYNRIGILKDETENIQENTMSIVKEREFPPVIIDGIQEYYAVDNKRLTKESGMVMIVRKVISDFYEYMDQHDGERPAYNDIINEVIKNMMSDSRILKSELSLNDLNLISDKLRGEALYYDFLL